MIVLLFTIILSQTQYPVGTLPDLALTPGAADPSVTQDNVQQTICKHGYTKTVRDVNNSEKKQAINLYEQKHPDWPKCKPFGEADCEYDHLISLELGGSNDITNLWPAPYCPLDGSGGKTCFGSREKDVVETAFHRRICNEKMTLQDAQQRIATNWLIEYKKIKALEP